MQISRHWRLNAQRYRLEGVRREDGSVSLQNRVVPRAEEALSEIPSQQTQQREQEADATQLQRMAS